MCILLLAQVDYHMSGYEAYRGFLALMGAHEIWDMIRELIVLALLAQSIHS